MTRRSGAVLALPLASLLALPLANGCTSEPLACEGSADCGRGERCVDGRCTSTPVCGDGCECETDAQCTLGMPACVEALCVEGACFVRADDALCASGTVCDEARGCVSGSSADGGADAGGEHDDAGGHDADAGADPGSPDAGSPGSPDAGDEGCGITSSDPLFQPEGFTQREVAWEDAFFGNSFPIIDHGGLSPVGSFTFRSSRDPSGIPMTGQYISIPFVPEPASNYRLDWYRSQAVYSRDYYVNYPAEAVFVSISPCPGDFRLPDYTLPAGELLSQTCRAYDGNGAIYYGTSGTGSQCALEAGRTYYLNILFANPYGGLEPTETTCVDGPLCNANFGM